MCSRFIRNAAYWKVARKGSRNWCRISPFPTFSGTCDFYICWSKASDRGGFIGSKFVGYGLFLDGDGSTGGQGRKFSGGGHLIVMLYDMQDSISLGVALQTMVGICFVVGRES